MTEREENLNEGDGDVGGGGRGDSKLKRDESEGCKLGGKFTAWGGASHQNMKLSLKTAKGLP